MNDIENYIINTLATTLRSTYTGIFVTGEYTPTPKKFPCVFIEQGDSFADVIDGSNTERVTGVMFEINIFSNLASGKKAECKKIAKTIDAILTDLGFARESLMPTDNIDPSVYRMTGRYIASVSDNTIYRR